MTTDLLPGETIQKQGMANMMRGLESVGGKLYLTSQRIVFESHSLNIQTGSSLVPLTEVESTELCWTKILNLIPVMPNSIRVNTANGNKLQFVVFGRGSWKAEIDRLAS